MATTRIADLPSATTINDAVYVAIDSYTTEGTCKVSPSGLMSILVSASEIDALARRIGAGSVNASLQSVAPLTNSNGGEE